MPYIVRDRDGNIAALHARKGPNANEPADLSDPALRRFLADGEAVSLHGKLTASDLDLVRVLEDVIYLLIDRRIIMLTDLPPAAQAKLALRRDLRGRLGDLGGIVAETEEAMPPLP